MNRIADRFSDVELDAIARYWDAFLGELLPFTGKSPDRKSTPRRA